MGRSPIAPITDYSAVIDGAMFPRGWIPHDEATFAKPLIVSSWASFRTGDSTYGGLTFARAAALILSERTLLR